MRITWDSGRESARFQYNIDPLIVISYPWNHGLPAAQPSTTTASHWLTLAHTPPSPFVPFLLTSIFISFLIVHPLSHTQTVWQSRRQEDKKTGGIDFRCVCVCEIFTYFLFLFQQVFQIDTIVYNNFFQFPLHYLDPLQVITNQKHCHGSGK